MFVDEKREVRAVMSVFVMAMIFVNGVGIFVNKQTKRNAEKAKQCLVDHTDTQYKFVDRPDTLMFVGRNGGLYNLMLVGRDGVVVRHIIDHVVDNKDAIKHAVRGDEILVHTSETMDGELRRRVVRNITQDKMIQDYTKQR